MKNQILLALIYPWDSLPPWVEILLALIGIAVWPSSMADVLRKSKEANPDNEPMPVIVQVAAFYFVLTLFLVGFLCLFAQEIDRDV